jgi:hypothetical protein
MELVLLQDPKHQVTYLSSSITLQQAILLWNEILS